MIGTIIFLTLAISTIAYFVYDYQKFKQQREKEFLDKFKNKK
jgi:hypothetical protein